LGDTGPMNLDPDDPRPAYVQVASSLRAGILTRQYGPGEKLPSGGALAERYGVARMTIQQAIRILRDEGLITSRAGSGVFARANPEPPVGLHSQLERAFDAEDVTLDFFGITGEDLHEAIREPLDKIRTGRHHPRSIRIRALVPDGQKPRTPPPGAKTRKDAPARRARTHSFLEQHLESLLRSVTELAELGLVQSATAELRSQPASPLFRLYIINGREAFQGFDPLSEHPVNIEGSRNTDGEPTSKDTPLFHQEATDDPEAVGSQFVNQATTWFDSIWTNNSTDVNL
jgi:DNA-binding transcriptional regulator YhcF (GntR family)